MSVQNKFIMLFQYSSKQFDIFEDSVHLLKYGRRCIRLPLIELRSHFNPLQRTFVLHVFIVIFNKRLQYMYLCITNSLIKSFSLQTFPLSNLFYLYWNTDNY